MNVRLQDRVEIQDGYFVRIEQTAVGKAPVKDVLEVLNKYYSKQVVISPLLPGLDTGCRLYVTAPKRVGFLMQSNPLVRKILYRQKKTDFSPNGREPETMPDDEDAYPFTVSMPWTWVMCVFERSMGSNPRYWWHKCFLCSSYKNLSTLDDPVFSVPLPNQWGNSGEMCTGDVITDSDKDATYDPGFLCRKWMFLLWNSWFNDDLQLDFPTSIRRNTYFEALEEWEKLTEKNPGCALSEEFGLVPYPVGEGRLRDFVEWAVSGGDDDQDEHGDDDDDAEEDN